MSRMRYLPALGATRTVAATLLFAVMAVSPLSSAPQRADALVLVNSTSARHADFQFYIQPYLHNFGVPYSVLDIATNPVGTSVGDSAVIIVGHRQLDMDNLYLDATEQANLSLAVSNGTGLVNFEYDLSIYNIIPRYQFVQDVFGFGYAPGFYPTRLTFPTNTHYITARHATGENVYFDWSPPVVGITLSTNVQAIVLADGQPFLTVTRFGQGRAVQWGNYYWISKYAKGQVYGLDDLVWRSLVWAARKPLVLRAVPNFVTLRVDDASGPFSWAHTAAEVGLKPWVGAFLKDISTSEAQDLAGLAQAGQASVAIHSFGAGEFFYFHDSALGYLESGTNWPDEVMAAHFATGTQWHQTNGIPISKIVIPHYYEIGDNAFSGLRDWGVEFLGIPTEPGTPCTALWIRGGPYRLYEEPEEPLGCDRPFCYAHFIAVPGHPEWDGQFFNCFTEIRDSAGYEWYPDSNVAASIARGTSQVKRAFDSLVLATLFTHEGSILPIASNDWRAILQGITNNLAADRPQYVTVDYACQYVRALWTAAIGSADYDPAQKQLRATLVGRADLTNHLNMFMGEDNAITNISVVVPPFSNTLTVTWTERPDPPAGLTAKAGNVQVSLAWFPSPHATSYRVKRAISNPSGTYTPIATGVTVTNYTDTNVVNGTTYYYVVSAVNAGGESGNSAYAGATPLAVLNAPTDLTASALSSSRIYLRWTDRSNNETGFAIERSTNQTNYTQIATVGSNVRSYTNTGLSSRTRYYYRVRAYNNNGYSAYSNVANARTN